MNRDRWILLGIITRLSCLLMLTYFLICTLKVDYDWNSKPWICEIQNIGSSYRGFVYNGFFIFLSSNQFHLSCFAWRYSLDHLHVNQNEYTPESHLAILKIKAGLDFLVVFSSWLADNEERWAFNFVPFCISWKCDIALPNFMHVGLQLLIIPIAISRIQ